MFPLIEKDWMVLMKAELSTGKVLDLNNEYAIKPDQQIYKICKNTDEALNLAKLAVSSNSNIECYIYDSNNTLKYKVTIFELEEF